MNHPKIPSRKVLEHKNQKVLALPLFLIRLGRFALFAFSLVAFSVGFGTMGYHFIANLSWLDSLYMSSMILTGMGPVADMTTDNAKLFSSFYALYSGVAFLSISAVFFTPIIHRLLHILHLEDSNPQNG
ncbi:hypothetical protein D0X99_13400 [Algoriphagus lacus]|uniref:Two pore domain potassium channel family protein n=1 Tax=Algoriphagus lacus TaxID=2056311 RepID=A0A418PQG8_9BACT|nr:hypothetical protein [Algoriphagus lacus]RIW14544.1 hypothetical protein D0X99_13400 [Algoriphagus lacus]